jgi:hypothetical protein
MNHAAKFSPLMGKRPPDMAIAWEATPSLQHLVVRADDVRHEDAAPTWAETMPVSLEALSAPEIFHEPLEGLSVRDIDEPEIFQVLFGGSAAPLRHAA